MKITKQIAFSLLLAALLAGLLPVWAEDSQPELPTLFAVTDAAPRPLSAALPLTPGQLVGDSAGAILESDLYGSVVNYRLYKGRTLSLSDPNYVFSVRVLENGNYSTVIKPADAASYTATADMTVACLVRKADKSPMTPEELAAVTLRDTQYGMADVPGSVHRFTVRAQTITGGLATTRAAIFLPESYSDEGAATPLIIMTNGRSGYLTDSVWNGNSADNVALMDHYMKNGYAVVVVNNTAGYADGADDWGNPQLVDSYWKAYAYVQSKFNLEELFSIHSRSMGTFAAVRMMRERPQLVKCALMCGPVLSLESRFHQNPAFLARRYGFEDTSGAVYEADKVAGYDPYTDVDGPEYTLPPTFWMMAEEDATSAHLATVSKIVAQGNQVTQKVYTDTDHNGVCRLSTEACRADALAFLQQHRTSTADHRFGPWSVTTAPSCISSGVMIRTCADCGYREPRVVPALTEHLFTASDTVCDSCGELFDLIRTEIPVLPGQLVGSSSGTIQDSEIYGHVVHYSLQAGHTLSISDPRYLFSVRILQNGSYSTMLKQASRADFTADADMTVGCLIRKPDSSAVTAEELAGLCLYDTFRTPHEHKYGPWTQETAPVCSAEGRDTRSCSCGDTQYRDTRVSGDPGKILVSSPVAADFYSGKTLVCIGDSITCGIGVTADQTDYVTLLARQLDMDYVRLGVSGTTLCTGGHRTCNIGQLTEEKLRGADVVTIFMGINDWDQAREGYYALGDLDSTDTSTIYGAAHMWCRQIVQLRQTEGLQDTQFCFATPVITSWNDSVTSQRSWDQSKTNIHGYTLRDLCQAIMEVCAQYDIPVLDLNLYSGMYYRSEADNNLADFGGDGVHPGVGGHAMMAEAFQEFLLESYRCESRPVTDNGHAYTAVTTPPTCTAEGYTLHSCRNCGHSYVTDRVAARHRYSGGVCGECGSLHPTLANYSGKVISILGDSISTFAGYIPTADGFNLEHLPRYPQDDLLTDVNETWWMQVITRLGGKLGINDSWRGATVSGAAPVTSGSTGANAAMANLTRIRNLGSNGTPDLILFYGGTNDLAHVAKVGTFDPAAAPDTADLTTASWDNLADGYVHTLLRLRHFYPEAQILCLLPTYTGSYYTDTKLAQANTVLAAICEHYGVACTDLRHCELTTADLPDGIHPDANGMDHITAAVLEALSADCRLQAGEHRVHSVTHVLTGAVSSHSYIKGVSAGKPFEALITGRELTVTVTMGGADITASAYAEGRIAIPAVTGDIVITAAGRVTPIHQEHLQPLPEAYCSGTNLWTALTPENTYYTGSAWGNLSGNLVWSVTIPVEPGQQLWATSFQAYGPNGNTFNKVNGIRLTWFDGEGVLRSVDPEEVHAEFAQNGRITVPQGAEAANIVMWDGSPDNQLFLLSAGHSYGDYVRDGSGNLTAVCTGCGHGDSRPDPLIPYRVDSVELAGDTCRVTVTNRSRQEGGLLCLAAYTAEGRFLGLATADLSGLAIGRTDTVALTLPCSGIGRLRATVVASLSDPTPLSIACTPEL